MQINWQPGITLEQIEKQVILKAYSFFQCNKTKTAAALDIAVRTLDAKLEKYSGVKAPDVEATEAIPEETKAAKQAHVSNYKNGKQGQRRAV